MPSIKPPLRRSYKKSLTFTSFDRLSSSLSNRLRRARSSSSFGPNTAVPNNDLLKQQHEQEIASVPLERRADAPSDKSTCASSSNSLDADAALLSSTLVKVHQNMDGWHTGDWGETAVLVPQHEEARVRYKPRFSLRSMACCGKIDDTLDEVDKNDSGFLPYKISRRRSSMRGPQLEIECTLKDKRGECLLEDGPLQPDTLICKSSSDSVANIAAGPQLPHPAEWTYSPLLLTATPGSGMVIRRVRRACDVDSHSHDQCLGLYAQLPINNGKEMYSLVIDFETPSFEGTALFRIRNSGGADNEADATSTSQRSRGRKGGPDYFASYNRKFQMVIRGKFRRPDITMADCMSGMVLDHALRTAGSTITDPLMACAEMNPPESTSSATTKKGRRKKKTKDESLPPRWVLRASKKIAGLFSPRMDADLECSHPRILSPLCSMAQSVHVGREGECPALDAPHAEPHHQSTHSLVNELRDCQSDNSGNSSVQIRKKTFDSVYDERISRPQSVSPCFNTEATYTFEFLQHLIDYTDFSLDFGTIVGKMKLGGALRGQPCRFVAGVVTRYGQENDLTLKDMDCLWSFDLWHESLYVNRN